MKKSLSNYITQIAFTLLISCLVTAVKAQSPTVQNFSPLRGPVGADVKIVGTNFNPDKTMDLVLFGSIVAPITSVAPDGSSLMVKVPVGADLQGISVTDLASKLTGTINQGFDVTFSNDGVINFGSSIAIPSGVTPSKQVLCADFNQDGKPDVVMASDTEVFFFLNASDNGSALFKKPYKLAKPIKSTLDGFVAIADFNGDGMPDIAVTTTGANIVYAMNTTLPRDNAISFSNMVLLAIPNKAVSIATGDLNGDGKPDLVIPNNNYQNNVFYNTTTIGNVGFSLAATLSDFDINPKMAVIRDLDGDGKADIVVSSEASGSAFLTVYKNITALDGGVPSFITAIASGDIEMGNGVESFTIGDIDHDGKPDLIVPNQYLSKARLSIYKNNSTNGNIAFKAPFHNLMLGPITTGALLSDFDGDGETDIVLAQRGGGNAIVFKNKGTVNGATTFDISNVSTEDLQSGLAVADIDGDGKADVVYTDQQMNQLAVRLNIVNPSPYPSITSIVSPNGKPGDLIAINGTNFSAQLAKNIVFFGGVRVEVVNATPTKLEVKVPNLETYQQITVTNLETGWTAYSKKPFGVNFLNAGENLTYQYDYLYGMGGGAITPSITEGDLNGDGAADLVVANSGKNNISVFFTTNASGSITNKTDYPIQLPAGTNPYFSNIKLADFDGDGKQDIVLIDKNTYRVYFLRNLGGSPLAFDAVKGFNTGGKPNTISIADLDGDGKPDAVIANAEGSISVLRNTSTATALNFIVTDYQLPGTAPISVALGDLDEDGLPDMILPLGTGNATVYHNNSKVGTIKLDAALNIVGPGLAVAQIADLDNDGKNDLIMSNASGLKIYKNENLTVGTPAFGTPLDITGVFANKLALADADGDGLVDIFALSISASNVRLITNKSQNGNLAFAKTRNYGIPGNINTTDFVVGDIDGHNGPDFIVTSETSGSLSVFASILYDAPPTIDTMVPSFGKVGDIIEINGTGFSGTIADNVVFFGATKAEIQGATTHKLTVKVPQGANFENVSVTNLNINKSAHADKPFGLILPNSYGALFASPVDFHAGNGTNPKAIAEADFDNDGYPDLAVANSASSSITVFINSKQPAVEYSYSNKKEISFQFLANPNLTSIKVDDFNNDGYPDLVCLDDKNNTIYLLKNAGTPTIGFTLVASILLNAKPISLAIGDIDVDGYSDIVVATVGQKLEIYRNQGTLNHYEPATVLALQGVAIGSIAFGDLDEDKIPDLIVPLGNRTAILHNSSEPGAISLKESDNIIGSSFTKVEIADLDNDGKNDFILGSPTELKAYTNTNTIVGKSSFNSVATTIGNVNSNTFALADLDGDGLTDIIASSATDNKANVIFNQSKNAGISFALPVAYNYGANVNSPDLVIGDINNDGRPDLMTVNPIANTVSVFKNNPAPPVITSFYPHAGPVGTEVNIKGKGFSPIADQNIVFFGAAMAKVKTVVSPNELIVIAPIGSDHQFVSLTNLTNNLTGSTAETFDITYAASGPLLFAPEVKMTTGVNPNSIIAKDLNGDGLVDFAVANLSGSGVMVYKNISTTGAVSFDLPISLTGTGSLSSIKLGDLDGDGLPDLAANDYTNGKINVFLNKSDKTDKNAALSFGNFQEYASTLGSSVLAIADVDNDGRMDIVTLSVGNTGLVAIHKNISTAPGALKFAMHTDFNVGVFPRDMAIGDLNKDGKLDIVAINLTGIKLLSGIPNANSISFSSTNVTTQVTNPTGISISDFNADGNPDLGIAEYGNIKPLTVKLGQGNLLFGNDIAYTGANVATGIAMGDVNGDGLTDVAIAFEANKNIGIFENNPANKGVFLQMNPLALTSTAKLSLFEDVDGDGKLDIVALDYAGKTFSVLLNNQVIATDVITLAATNITANGAILNGSVRANSSAVKVWFEVGNEPDLSAAASYLATTNSSLPVASTFSPATYTVTNQSPGTFYYRTTAVNAANETNKGQILKLEIPVSIIAPKAIAPNPVKLPIGVVEYRVDFSNEIYGLNKANFNLVATGAVEGAVIVDVAKDQFDPNSWYVVVNVGIGGDGTLTLNMINATGIENVYQLPVAVSTNFPIIGETYTVDATAPFAPVSLTANAGDASVKLDWLANGESDLASYEIYGGTTPNPTTFIASVPVGTLTYTDVNLINGTIYYYRIIAKDVAGNEGPYSDQVMATPMLGQVPKQAQTITFTAIAEATYGDAAFDLPAKSDQGLDITYTSTSAAISITNKNHVTILHTGTAKIDADQEGDATYNAAGKATQTLSILARPISVKATATGKVQNSAEPALTYFIAQGQLYNGDVNAISGTPERETGEQPGVYKIHQGTVVANGDYALTFIEDDFTITPMPATVIAAPTNLTAIAGNAEVTLNWAANTEANLKEYRIYIGTVANPTVAVATVMAGTTTYLSKGLTNDVRYYYRITAVSNQNEESGFSNEIDAKPIEPVQKAVQTISFGAIQNRVYGDADFDAGAISDAGLDITYSTSNANIATIVNGKVHILHAGSVTIYANQSGNALYQAAVQAVQTLNIDKLLISVKADPKMKAFGAADPALTYTFSPALVVGDVFTGALTRPAGENPASYAVWQGTLSLSSDYILKYTAASFIIGNIPLTITADTQTKVYGDADPVFTYKITSGTLLNGAVISGSMNRSPGNNVGTYVIGQNSLTAGPSYTITFVPSNLSITPLAVTVTATAQQKSIGDIDPTLTYGVTAGKLIGTDNFSGSLNRAPGETLGTYAIGLGTLSLGNNYNLNFVASNLVISLKSIAAFRLDVNNILTPNGDGKNDMLVFNKLEQYPAAKLTIADREGRVVYTSGNYQNDWDGTFKGNPLATNTYYYIVDFGSGYGKFKGFVTILRTN